MNIATNRTFFSLFGDKVRFYRSDISFEGDCYMERWILRTPWGDVRLHHILRSDNDRALHDHPFDFTSIMLWGAYVEWMETDLVPPLEVRVVVDGVERYPSARRIEEGVKHYAPCVIRHKAEDLHRLQLDQGSVWTLVFAGPIRRKWGFKTMLHGWIEGDNYCGEL